MKSPITWSVGRKLTALAGIGLAIASTVGVVAVNGLSTLDSGQQGLISLETAGSLTRALDTRASELKVDAYKSVTLADTSSLLTDLADDVKTPQDLIAQLDALPLNGADKEHVVALEAGYTTYINEMSAFVKAGVANQKVMLPRVGEIQKSNDKTDASLGGAIDFFAQRIAVKESELKATLSQTRTLTIVVCLAGLVALALGAFLISRSITRPLGRFVLMLLGVASGDLTGRLEVSSAGELGTLEGALNAALVRLRETMSAMGNNAQGLASSSEELSSVSSQMTGSAEESATQANLVSAAAEQVSRNVQTVATGTEEMSASIREIAKNAHDAAGVAAQAVHVAETTSATVAKLGQSSAEIGNVIKVINSIAEQTNLLALNATIEAARAGEAGKGFAVVANEVKELAQETSKATEDIGQRIEAIQSDTAAAVAAITEISGIIAQINDTQSTIASAVEEQTATTNEMGRNVTEAATGSSDIAENITGVARSASDTTAAASSTSQAADELARMASDLQQLVGQFSY